MALVALATAPGPAFADEQTYMANDPAVTVQPKERGVVRMPYAMERLKPPGSIEFEYCVNAKGQVTDVAVVKSTFDKTVDDAVTKWTKSKKFDPGQVAGKPVAVCGIGERFLLSKPPERPYPPGSEVKPDTPPIMPVDMRAPDYPPAAGGATGVVGMDICVAPDGKVASMRLARSSKSAELDKSAMSWLFKAKLTPAMLNGAPVGVCGFLIEYDWKAPS
jgi:TonB family protein